MISRISFHGGRNEACNVAVNQVDGIVRTDELAVQRLGAVKGNCKQNKRVRLRGVVEVQ